MLTYSQCQVTAYLPLQDGDCTGEGLICPECARARAEVLYGEDTGDKLAMLDLGLDTGLSKILSPVIAYNVDEWGASQVESFDLVATPGGWFVFADGGDWSGPYDSELRAEDAYITAASTVYCDSCWSELRQS